LEPFGRVSPALAADHWTIGVALGLPKVLSHAGVVLNYSTMVTAHDERAFWQGRNGVDGVANDGFYTYIMSILVVLRYIKGV
jgi:hypothetical protein